jgi:hypothetical protein
MKRREFVKCGLAASAIIVSRVYAIDTRKGSPMVLENLKVTPNNSTLMGVVKGVSDYYGFKYSDGMLYGGSGHAFFINIHKELCPSGPYCWNRKPFYGVLENLGIEMTDQGFYSGTSSKEERQKIETILKSALNGKEPCALINMEYQMINGYDETGFLTSQPWAMDFPPKHLTFETWSEMGSEVHVNYFTFKHIEPKNEKEIIKQSLLYALDVNKNPSLHTSEPYFTGSAAYDAWSKSLENGTGAANGHGCWWNGTVWCECRTMASKYFNEISEKYPTIKKQASSLSKKYETISDGLRKVADKNVEGSVKIATLKTIKAQEADCLPEISEIIKAI